MKRSAPLALVILILSLVPVSITADSYTVFTYNLGLLRVLGSDLVPLVAARTKAAPRALAAFAADAKPHIMLLEEVWEDAAADAIAKQLSPLGYASTRPNIHGMFGLSSGLLLLVRAPLQVIDWKFIPFSHNTVTDSFARKGVLEATLEDAETGARFVLLGTHTVALDTTNGVARDKGQIDVITAQMAQILAALDSRSQKGSLPALILGDFNVGPAYCDTIYRIIADAPGIREVASVLGSADPLNTWDRDNPLVHFGHYPDEPSARIDHVFLRDSPSESWQVVDVRVMQKDFVPGLSLSPSGKSTPLPTPLSDHYGLLAQIAIAQSR